MLIKNFSSCLNLLYEFFKVRLKNPSKFKKLFIVDHFSGTSNAAIRDAW